MPRSERTVSLIWPVPDLINLNAERRLHHHARAQLVRRLRDAFRSLAADVHPITGPIEVIGRFQWADRRRRDTSNWLPTLKAAVDGLEDAGVIPRDDDTFIRDTRIGPEPEPAPGLAGYCRITITLREVA